MNRAQQASPHLKVSNRVMTAPAAAIASFVQPAAKLAMGDSVGAAVGGFEALLAMLTQSLQGGAEGQTQATTDGEAGSDTQAPAENGDLAALLGQVGVAPWLTQALSQATGDETTAPVTCDVTQTKGPMIDLTSLAPQTDAEAAVPADQASDEAADALAALFQRQTPEAVDPAVYDRIKALKGQTAAQSLQSLLTPVAPPAEEAVETAVVVQAQAVATELATDAQTPPAAETVAAPAVIPPPAEAKAPTPPRKGGIADAKAVKTDTVDAAAATKAVATAEVDAPDEELAPVDVAAREAETPEAPARNPETLVQTLAAKLETVATGAAALAAQVRGAPETVAKLAAGILDKLEGQSTKFDLQLDPHGLGKVDVSVEIASDGKLTAQLGFDSQLGLSELRGRVQELRTALEQAGFSLSDTALSFDFNGERRQQTADGQADRSDQAGKAFARALGALDEELAAVPTRYQARRGLDLLI